MKAKWSQSQGQEMDFFSNYGFMPLRFTVHHKNTNGIIYVAEITPLNSFQHYLLHGITTVINRPHFHSLTCSTLYSKTCIFWPFMWLTFRYNIWKLPGKVWHTHKRVCTFMCKNNAWIKSMCRVIYISYERRSRRRQNASGVWPWR